MDLSAAAAAFSLSLSLCILVCVQVHTHMCASTWSWKVDTGVSLPCSLSYSIEAVSLAGSRSSVLARAAHSPTLGILFPPLLTSRLSCFLLGNWSQRQGNNQHKASSAPGKQIGELFYLIDSWRFSYTYARRRLMLINRLRSSLGCCFPWWTETEQLCLFRISSWTCVW